MSITRITGTAKGRSPAVHHSGVVYAVATAGSNSSSVPKHTPSPDAAVWRFC